jgi:hypothetical protein
MQDDDFDDKIKKTAAAEKADADVPATAKADTPPPGHQLVDPFAHYAASEGAEAFFDGDYVKIDQEHHAWVRGREKEPIGATEAFVANMPETRHGHIKFAKSDGEGVERHTMLIMECPELPPCPACGIADEHDDKRCDWRPVVYLPLRSVTDPTDVVCFTGNGLGARRALAQLCRIYAREGADHQGKGPTILLEARSFKNDAGGTTTWPVFKRIGWDYFTPGVPAPQPRPVAVPIAPPSPPATPRKRGAVDDMDDEIPF